MLGAVSQRPFPPKLLLAFRALAETGKTPKDFGCPQPDPKPGHPDGWGIACVGEAEEVYRRGALKATADPAYEDAVKAIARMANPPFFLLASVRRSPRRDEIRLEFSHPFRRETANRLAFFAHDGALEGHGVRNGRTDSIAIFDRLVEGLGAAKAELGDFKRAVAAAKESFDREFPRRAPSYTFLMIDGDRIVAHRDARNCVPYYSLHETRQDDVAIVCSEVLEGFEGRWRLLRNGEFLELRGPR